MFSTRVSLPASLYIRLYVPVLILPLVWPLCEQVQVEELPEPRLLRLDVEGLGRDNLLVALFVD